MLHRPLRVSEPLVLAVGAAVVTALILGLAPPGTDFAAHAYQRTLFARHGFGLWDNGWYAGRYEFVTYSVLYYPLAAVFGMAVLAVAGQAAAVGTFASLVLEEFGPQGRWAARTFALVWPAFVLTAAFPSGLGMTLALLALRALQRGRTALACLACVLTLAASPLAFLLLTVLLAAIALGNRVRDRRLVYPALTVLALGAFELLLWRVFPSQRRSHFALGAMLAVVAFCGVVVALTWGVERARVLLWLCVVYGATAVLAYRSPRRSETASRDWSSQRCPSSSSPSSLAPGAGVRRALVVAAVALAAWLNVSPLASSFVAGVSTSASDASYWAAGRRLPARPPEPQLPRRGRRHRSGTGRRCTWRERASRWHADGFARTTSPERAPLPAADGAAATSRGCGRWPCATSCSGRHAGLHRPRRGGAAANWRAGLRVALRAAHLTIFEVAHPRPIVTGPGRARMVSLTENGAVLDVARAGTYRVASATRPIGASCRVACARRSDGMTRLTVPRAGRVKLAFSWTAERALDVVAGSPASDCRRARP